MPEVWKVPQHSDYDGPVPVLQTLLRPGGQMNIRKVLPTKWLKVWDRYWDRSETDREFTRDKVDAILVPLILVVSIGSILYMFDDLLASAGLGV